MIVIPLWLMDSSEVCSINKKHKNVYNVVPLACIEKSPAKLIEKKTKINDISISIW